MMVFSVAFLVYNLKIMDNNSDIPFDNSRLPPFNNNCFITSNIDQP